ncbi:MAG: cytochrome c biogenesis protein ResB, partial [Candidatus Krumholzibacteria bacterium]|nr:cytochrome c biogenesis protein ResB [Candidatus Krumholzibacteria bacterium]
TGPAGAESGWVFPLHPGFGTNFTLVRRLAVRDLEPRYYTGLEIAVNPGAPVLVAGMIMASVGLFALLVWHHRVLRGRIDADGIEAVGTQSRWKVSFREEIDRIGREVEAAIASSAAPMGKDRRI